MKPTGAMRAAAAELQRVAWGHPLARAHDPNDARFFRRIDRELTWGLTLNK